MPPILNLWRKGASRPKAWPGAVMDLDPDAVPSALITAMAHWAEANPGGWWVASGPAAALFIRLAADRLDLHIAGAALIAPQDWPSPHGLVPLTEPPMPFPTLLFPRFVGGNVVSLREKRLAQAWQSRLGGAVPPGGPLATSMMIEMMQRRLPGLGPRT